MRNQGHLAPDPGDPLSPSGPKQVGEFDLGTGRGLCPVDTRNPLCGCAVAGPRLPSTCPPTPTRPPLVNGSHCLSKPRPLRLLGLPAQNCPAQGKPSPMLGRLWMAANIVWRVRRTAAAGTIGGSEGLRRLWTPENSGPR